MREESASLAIAVERLAAEQEHARGELRQLREDMREEFREVREDLRRLDNRIFQTLLGILATLATAVGALIAAFVA
jgi:hypothetical protein